MLIFCVRAADGLIGDGILGISVLIGLVKGLKIVGWFVGDGGGEGYGTQTVFGAMAGKL